MSRTARDPLCWKGDNAYNPEAFPKLLRLNSCANFFGLQPKTEIEVCDNLPLKVDICLIIRLHRLSRNFGQNVIHSLSTDPYWGGSYGLTMANKKKSLRKIFATHLRTVRNERGLTQEELGYRSGLHRTYISSLEHGERNVSIDNIERLARALGVEEVELLRR